MNTSSNHELLPWESGKQWRVPSAIHVCFDGKTLTVPEGFMFDRYTWAPDLQDVMPSAAHDYAYIVQKWDDGTPMARSQADRMFRFLMSMSQDSSTRTAAKWYFRGVRLAGWYGWWYNRTHDVKPVIQAKNA